MIRGGCRILRKPLSGAVLALLLLTGSAAGQDLSRADPVLRYLLMTRPPPAAEAPLPALDRPAGLARQLQVALEREPGRTWVRTLVRVGPGGVGALLRAGADVRTRAGDIVTARIPLDALPDLLVADGIRSVAAATPMVVQGFAGNPGGGAASLSAPVALSDSAMADAGFDALRRRVDDRWEGLTGTGVIVGIYDSGLDLKHGDFIRPDSTSRVIYAWDQTTAHTPPPGMLDGNNFNYGAECTAAIIEEGNCSLNDQLGHGTHVAGIAAADGSATGKGRPPWRFTGAAPDADLIIVKGSNDAFAADKMLDGVAYIFARAQELGRPAVVNLSLAATSGARDGTETVEQALDALVGPGRIIVAGAGNNGDFRNTDVAVVNGPLHAQGVGSGTHRVVIPTYPPTPGAGNDGVLLELWYDGADSLSVTVTSPAGASLTVATGDSATLDTDGGAIAIQNALDGPAPANGDNSALIGIVDAREVAPPDSGRWTIQISTEAIHAGGEYHLWIDGATFNTQKLTVLEGGTTNRYLVTIPATADRVIAVGAHVTRRYWDGVGDVVQSWEANEDVGDIAFFSSPGPRRDGVLKPDLTAPGKMVISSLSSDQRLWDSFPTLVEADSVHAALMGTSMSSPVVAGAVALMLQLDPELTPEDVRDALRLSATVDGFVGSPAPNPVWGAGKLDAGEAVKRVRPDGLAGADEPVNLSQNPVRGDLLIINYPERPTSAAIYTLVAERVRTFSDRELNPVNVIWPLDTDAGGDVANGAYVLVLEYPDHRVVRKIFVARP